MMKNLKKPLSLVLCLLMCVSLMAGIVLPPVGENVIKAQTAVQEVEEPAVPYAKVEDVATKQTVTLNLPSLDDSGNVQTDENGATVYAAETKENVYVANVPDKWLYIVDKNLLTNDMEKKADADGYFFYTYGDGTTWGDKTTYKVKLGVNIFTSFETMVAVLREETPQIGQEAVVLMAPGSNNSTGDGTVTTNTFKLPEGTTADTITEEKILNVYFYGPQAGKDPLGGKSAKEITYNSNGLVATANGRNVDDETEAVFTGALWFPVNAVYHMDGFAGRQDFSFYSENHVATLAEGSTCSKPVAELTDAEKASDAETIRFSGMYMTNFFCQWKSGSERQTYALFRVGGTSEGNITATVFHLNNSVFDHTGSNNTSTDYNFIQGNNIKIDNCAFVDFNTDPEVYKAPWRLRISPTQYERTASLPFYGGDGTFTFDYTNNYIPNLESMYGLQFCGTFFDPYEEKATINIENNRWENFGGHYTDYSEFLVLDWLRALYEDGKERYVSSDTSGCYIDYEILKLNIKFIDNYVSVNPEVTEKKAAIILNFGYLPVGSTAPIIKGNTFKADVTEKKMSDVSHCGPLTDLSGNLFLDKDGNVREAHADDVQGYLREEGSNLDSPDGTGRARYTNAKVLSDIYASDERAGGIKELMNVMESPEGLAILHSDIQLTDDDESEYAWIKGTMTVLPHHNKTYKTANLFDWTNENVKLEGVYRDENCRYPLESIDKAYFDLPTDATSDTASKAAFAKVVYTAGSTTCTVVFRMVMPRRYIFIIGDDHTSIANISYPFTKNEDGTYTSTTGTAYTETFNGDEYTLDLMNSLDDYEVVRDSDGKDTCYKARDTVNGIQHYWVAETLSFGTAEGMVRDPAVGNYQELNWWVEPLKDVIVFTKGVHYTGSSLDNGWSYDIGKSIAMVGSGFELDEPAVIQEDTELDQNVTIDYPITLGAAGTGTGTEYKAGDTIPAHTKLIKGDPNPKYACADIVPHIGRGEFWLTSKVSDIYFSVTGLSVGGRVYNEIKTEYNEETGTMETVYNEETGEPENEMVYHSFQINVLNQTAVSRASFINMTNALVMSPSLMTQKNQKLGSKDTANNEQLYNSANYVYFKDIYYNWGEKEYDETQKTTASQWLLGSGQMLTHIRIKAVTFRMDKSVCYGLGHKKGMESSNYSQNRLAYVYAPDPEIMPYTPYESVIRITDTDWIGGTAHGVTGGWFQTAGAGDWYDGLEYTMTGCRAFNFKYPIAYPMPGAGKACKLTFNDNYVYNSEVRNDAVVDGYATKSDLYPNTEETSEYKSAEIKGNVFINRTHPFDLNFWGTVNQDTPNCINVDENVFLLTDQTVEENNPYAKRIQGYDGYEKSDWYYMTQDFSIKSTDLYPVLANPSEGTVTVTENAVSGDNWKAEISCAANNMKVKDFAAQVNENGSGTITLYTDSTFATEVASSKTWNKGETVYAKIVFTSNTGAKYTAYWTISLGVTKAWAEVGLAPVDNETYVDVTTQDLYKKRAGGNGYGLLVVSPDWQKIAYTTYENGVLSNPISSDDTTRVKETPDINQDNKNVWELKKDTEFFAQMPTTGIVYKFTYGVTAMNVNHANTAAAGTVVLFPGAYYNKTAYTEGRSLYVSDFHNDGLFAIGLNDNKTTYPSYGCTNFRVLGPQAGVAGGNPQTGTTARGYALYGFEAVMAQGSSFYLRDGALQDGSTCTIDGVSISNGCAVTTAAGGGADEVYKTKANSTITVKNCVGGNMETEDNLGVFRICAADQKSVGSDVSKNTCKSNITLNIEDCYFERATDLPGEDQSIYYWGKTQANSIHIRRSSFISQCNGFLINPGRGDLNNGNFALNYTCEDSYISNTSGDLFNIDCNGTSNLQVRSALNIDLSNNKFVNMGAPVASIVALPDNVASKLNVTFNDNEVTTQTTKEYALSLGTTATVKANSYEVSGNTFKGYDSPINTAEPYDYKNNLFFDIDGNPIAPEFNETTSTLSDVMLSDYKHQATDFNIVGGAAEPAAVSWDPLDKMNDVTGLRGSIRYPYYSALTSDILMKSIRYASDKVVSKGLYTDAQCTKAATSLNNDVIYYLKAEYTDGNNAVAVYAVILGEDVDYPTTQEYIGDRIYLVPKADTGYSAKGKGDWVKYELDLNGDGEKEAYYFVVDKNITNDVTAVPQNKVTGDYDVYLFDNVTTGYSNSSYVYTAADLSLNDEIVADRVYNFYGAQKDISPVIKDEITERPTDELSPARSTNAETYLNGDFQFLYGTKVTINGVTFKGERTRLRQDSNVEDGDILSTLNLLYCVTLDSKLSGKNGDDTNSFVHLKDYSRHTGTFKENYMKFNSSSNSAGLIVLRHPYSVTFDSNYLENSKDNTCTNMFWISTCTADSTKAFADPTAIEIKNNTILGNLYVNRMDPVYTLDWKITNNEWIPNRDGDQQVMHFGFAGSTYKDSTNVNLKLTIQDNVISPAATECNGGLTAIWFDDVYTPNFTQNFSGNVFDNSEGTYLYGIDNRSDVENVFNADFSNDNTFKGFTYNFGDADYMTGTFAARNYTDRQRVLFSNGSNHATFIYTEKEFEGFELDEKYSAETVDPNWSTLDAPASGHNVADENQKTIEDVVISDKTYHFKPGYGMFLRIEAPNGNLYFNSVPITANTDVTETVTNKDADGKDISFDVAKFKVSVCAADGTPVADYTEDTTDNFWYGTTIYRNPIRLFMNRGMAVDSYAADYTPDRPYSIRWRGNVVAVGYDTVSSLINRTGMAIIDYGMVYGNTDTVLLNDDELADKIQSMKHLGAVTFTENGTKKQYTKYSYCEAWNIQNTFNPEDKFIDSTQPQNSYENGRLYTHKLYNFRFTGLAPAKTRYGRMYLTFRVGSGETYTILSEIQDLENDLHTVTTPSETVS